MKITIEIERWELSALMEWHREEDVAAANKCEYLDADMHKQRRAELTKIWNAPQGGAS